MRSVGCAAAALICSLCLLPSTAARHVREYDSHDFYVLELPEDTDWRQAASHAHQLGAELVEQVGQLAGHWVLRAPKPVASSPLVNHAAAVDQTDPVLSRYARLRQKRALPSVLSLEKQVLRQRVKRVLTLDADNEHSLRSRPRQIDGVSDYIQAIVKRFSIRDPLFPKQWHLANDRINDNSINVTGVWAEGITGEGIKVAIVDDGLDSELPRTVRVIWLTPMCSVHSDDLADNFVSVTSAS